MSKNNFKAFDYKEVKKHQNILKMIGKISWDKLVLYMKN